MRRIFLIKENIRSELVQSNKNVGFRNFQRQDYLDNVVWIYHKLVQYNINGFENFKEHNHRFFDEKLYLRKENLFRINSDSSENCDIADKGIAIETNPPSSFLIGISR